jgi:glycosyltransferase involved in cell wall biosynthesis
VTNIALLPAGDRFEDFFDKIGVTLDSFRDELTGGWLFNYVEALNRCAIGVVLIFCSAHVGEPRRFVHAKSGANVTVLPVPWANRKLRGLRDRYLPASRVLTSIASYGSLPLGALRAELRRQKCEVILCQEYESPRFDVCVLLGRLLSLPVYATYQGANSPVSRFELPVRRLALRASAGLIVPSEPETARLHNVFGVPRDKIAPIPNPLDVSGWRLSARDAARAELGIPPSSRVVAWHGRVQIHRKGLDVLLNAWELVTRASENTNLRLLLIGSGRDSPELRRRIASRPSDDIIWIERYETDRSVLMRHLSCADVYVLPSRHEGFPVAAVEAMASALPIVGADVPGVADVLAEGEEGGGVVVAPENPEALACALRELLVDDERARTLGQQARLAAEQNYDLDVVGRRLVAFMFGDPPRVRST